MSAGEKPLLIYNENLITNVNNWDVLQYDIHLNIFPAQQIIEGLVNIRLVSTTVREDHVELDLISLTVDSVFIQGKKSLFHRYTYSLDIPVKPTGDTLDISIYYHGNPKNDGTGGFFFGEKVIFTMGEALRVYPPSTLRYWVPSRDVPDDKAAMNMSVTVPNNLMAVSNGRFVSKTEKENNTAEWKWKEEHPIATYLIAIAVSNYTVLTQNYQSISGKTIPLEFYITPEKKEKAERDWKNLPQMMSFFEETFSPYPFDRYSMVEVYGRGAMEHQTMTSYSSALITGDNTYDYIMAHELAHMWFGDYVTLGDWRELWLNEGFATYSEALYFENKLGKDYLKEYMSSLADGYFDEAGRLGVFAIYDPVYLWGGTIYDKGGWVLHMLRYKIGDQAFFKLIEAYLQKYGYKTSTITDFKNTAATVSGINLDKFFEQWIYGKGSPELYINWNVNKTDHLYKTSITVNQSQSWGQFEFPLEILYSTSEEQVKDTVWMDQKSKTFIKTLAFRPAELTVDPDNWLLKKVYIVGEPLPPGFGDNQFELAQNFPNPFNPDKQSNGTSIQVQVAQKNAPHKIEINIYNVQGQRVKRLLNKSLMEGIYTIYWDGRDDNYIRLPSGIYFYRLETKEKEIFKKLTLIN